MSDEIARLAAQYGWHIERKKVKNINFRVRSGEVKISLPQNISQQAAKAAILSRKDWLEHVRAEQKAQLAKTLAAAASAAEKREFSFFGKVQNLATLPAALAQNRAQAQIIARQILNGDFGVAGSSGGEKSALTAARASGGAAITARDFGVADEATPATHDFGVACKQDLLKDFAHINDFKEFKKALYTRELRLIFELFASAWCQQLDEHFCTLKITRARRYWGSCTKSSRTIKAALQLATQPLHCVNYVALHECAHLVYAHHGASFWALVRAQMRDFCHAQTALILPMDFDL